MERAKHHVLQSLQDTYSAAYRVSLLVIDGQGNPLSRPSLSESGEVLSRLMAQAEGYDLHAALQRHAQFVKDIGAVTRYDYETFLGMKYIVAPIKLPGEANGSIWAGPWLDSDAGEVERHWGDEPLPAAQVSIPADLMDRIGEFAEIAAAVLQPNKEEESPASRELGFLHSINRWNSSSANWSEEEALQLVLRIAGLNMGGYARRMEHERFEIVSMVGEESAAGLVGQSFHSGEGCLGHAALFQRRTEWEQTSGRSNGSLFSRTGFEPEWLVGYPVLVREEVRGVLFGGTSARRNKSRPSPLVLELVQLIVNQWAGFLHCSGLRETQKRQALLLSMLNEIQHSIAMIQDQNRILSIMVDAAHKLAGGTFSCIVLFSEPGRRTEAQVVSRGLSAERIARYAGEASERYRSLNARMGGQRERQPVYRKTSWGDPLMEFPLYYGRRAAGVLAVGLSEKDVQETDRFFLAVLAMIGEIRLYEVRQLDATFHSSYLELLGFSQSYWEKEGYLELLRKREILGDFARQLGFSPANRELLDQALMVSGYETTFLWETIPWHADAIRLLEEALSVMEYGGQADAYLEYGFSQEAQALALVLNHQREPQLTEPGGPLQSVALSLRETFEELMEERMPSVNLVTIGQGPGPREEEEQDYATLTVREREVLELLVQGYTNQDIAGKMFISAHTVKNHLTKIYMKLGVADRTSAMVKLLKN